MLTYTGQLLDVQTGDFPKLVFEGTRWDFGLQREVPASFQIAISYQEAKGKMISIEVKEGLTKTKQIWFRTHGTGQIVLQE